MPSTRRFRTLGRTAVGCVARQRGRGFARAVRHPRRRSLRHAAHARRDDGDRARAAARRRGRSARRSSCCASSSASSRPRLPACRSRGGAVGYFGYDLGRRLERIPSIAAADIAMPDLAIGPLRLGRRRRSCGAPHLARRQRPRRAHVRDLADALVARLSAEPPPDPPPFRVHGHPTSNLESRRRMQRRSAPCKSTFASAIAIR